RRRADDQKASEEKSLQAECPATSGASSLRCGGDDNSGHRTAQQKKRNTQNLDEESWIVGDELAAGNDKTYGNLCHEQSEQADKGTTVDITGDSAEEDGNVLEMAEVENGRARLHGKNPSAKCRPRCLREVGEP